MFLSPVFMQSFVNVTGVPVELYQTDGSVGAALGAGVGAKIFTAPQEAFSGRKPLKLVEPTQTAAYDNLYQEWKSWLDLHLQKAAGITQLINL
jgi:xylulokinase